LNLTLRLLLETWGARDVQAKGYTTVGHEQIAGEKSVRTAAAVALLVVVVGAEAVIAADVLIVDIDRNKLGSSCSRTRSRLLAPIEYKEGLRVEADLEYNR